jgi:hypothetical protein
MVSFPLRLILAAWSGAALAGLAMWAAGTPALVAGLVFWLGGTGAVFVLPLVSAGFRAAPQDADLRNADGEACDGEACDGEACDGEAHTGAERQRRLGREHARWAEDLAGEIAAARQDAPRKAG